jgi:hypothetical protein
MLKIIEMLKNQRFEERPATSMVYGILPFQGGNMNDF